MLCLKKFETEERNTDTMLRRNCYGDMFKMGIIDPLKVVRSALENAASSASMLLTIGCAMIEERESESLDSGLFNKVVDEKNI